MPTLRTMPPRAAVTLVVAATIRSNPAWTAVLGWPSWTWPCHAPKLPATPGGDPNSSTITGALHSGVSTKARTPSSAKANASEAGTGAPSSRMTGTKTSGGSTAGTLPLAGTRAATGAGLAGAGLAGATFGTETATT